MYVGMKYLYEIGVWGMILGLLGLGHRFMTGGGPVLRYATEAAYPFYILHQTVIIGVAYTVCGWELAAMGQVHARRHRLARRSAWASTRSPCGAGARCASSSG